MKRSIEELKKDIVFRALISGDEFTFHSTWGLFSPARIDAGSFLLLDHVSPRPDAAILDIGCGYGALGVPLAKRAPRGVTHMVDKDFVAVEYARRNAEANRVKNCRAYLSNGLNEVPAGTTFDLIVSNLPAKAERELFDVMFYDAHARLRRGGELVVVTVAGLKEFIKRSFTEQFGNCEKIKQSRTHVLSRAVRE